MHHLRGISPSPASSLHDGLEIRAQTASTNTTCLPQTLLSVVPSCAINCISSFASHNYPGSSCTDTASLIFLCTQPNTAGLTIGEGSVQCVVSFCAAQEQADLDVYNVCNGIANSEPRTAKTITATILGTSTSTSSTMSATLPASIGVPTSTEDVSTIVMATSIPTWNVNTAPTTSAASMTSMITASTDASSIAGAPSSTSTSATSSMTPGAVAMSDSTASTRGLSTPQIAGVAVGGAATVLVVLGLVLLALWMRRRRQNRRRSHRRSRLVEQTPPPDYQSPKKPSPTFSNIGSSLAVPATNGRFYGAPTPMEDKRRSFWRKSIRPEEIGVAVSPKLPGERSPASATSEQSFSALLRDVPPAALRPAALDLEAARDRRRHTARPDSEVTLIDDNSEPRSRKVEQIMVDNQPFILEKPPVANKPRGPRPNLQLPVVPESPPRNQVQARIPLTPTYDNGNVQMQYPSPPRNIYSPASSQGPLPSAERKLPPSSFYANRNVLQKRLPARLPLRAVNSPSVEPVVQPRSAQQPRPGSSVASAAEAGKLRATPMQRHSSVSSAYTEIEEDTSPEEVNKQLGLRANPPTTSTIPRNMLVGSSGSQSPIKDLRYPEVPRSAAVSRQADRPALLRESVGMLSYPPQIRPVGQGVRPSRDELVRAEASFMKTDTTSSDGYMSDSTMEFPEPPSTGIRSSSLAQLRNNPASGNKGLQTLRNVTFSDDRNSGTQTVSVAIPQRSPSSKARLTPSKSRTGDLYLTVEI